MGGMTDGGFPSEVGEEERVGAELGGMLANPTAQTELWVALQFIQRAKFTLAADPARESAQGLSAVLADLTGELDEFVRTFDTMVRVTDPQLEFTAEEVREQAERAVRTLIDALRRVQGPLMTAAAAAKAVAETDRYQAEQSSWNG